jgi:hypothetical protein
VLPLTRRALRVDLSPLRFALRGEVGRRRSRANSPSASGCYAACRAQATPRSANIELVNELKMTFSRVAIDVWQVMAAESNSCSTQGYFMLLVVRPHSLDKNPTSLRVDTVHKTVLDIDPP